jgi:ATP-binding cassette subfamily F protein 3
MEEASKAFGEIFGMKADIDEINEQLTIRTDYESDAYMKLNAFLIWRSSMPLKK